MRWRHETYRSPDCALVRGIPWKSASSAFKRMASVAVGCHRGPQPSRRRHSGTARSAEPGIQPLPGMAANATFEELDCGSPLRAVRNDGVSQHCDWRAASTVWRSAGRTFTNTGSGRPFDAACRAEGSETFCSIRGIRWKSASSAFKKHRSADTRDCMRPKPSPALSPQPSALSPASASHARASRA